MARNWKGLKKKMSRDAQKRIDARVQRTLETLPLAEVRKAIGLTQTQLAETLDMAQGSVSKIENAADMYLSTLRRFVQALGGELVVTASFPGKGDFVIDQFGPIEDEPPAKRSA